jgi:hypothetical protein
VPEEGDTILHIAAKLGRRDLLRWLADRPSLDRDKANARNRTAREVAREGANSRVFEEVFGPPASDTQALLPGPQVWSATDTPGSCYVAWFRIGLSSRVANL